MPIKSAFLSWHLTKLAIHVFIIYYVLVTMVNKPHKVCVYSSLYDWGERNFKKNSNCDKCQERRSTKRHKKKGKKPTLLWIVREDFSEN